MAEIDQWAQSSSVASPRGARPSRWKPCSFNRPPGHQAAFGVLPALATAAQMEGMTINWNGECQHS
eukprot:6480755-Amphidinium_carterae.1